MTLLEVGRVIRPHGLSGEVVVDLVTNRLERLEAGSRLSVQASDANPSTPPTLEVVSSRPHQGRYLVVFAGVHGREGAESLRGAVLCAEPIEDPEALYIHELIGSEVFEVDGTARGRVTAVEANPASDLLVLDGRSYVPMRFVVSSAEGRLVIDVPPGLFE